MLPFVVQQHERWSTQEMMPLRPAEDLSHGSYFGMLFKHLTAPCSSLPHRTQDRPTSALSYHQYIPEMPRSFNSFSRDATTLLLRSAPSGTRICTHLRPVNNSYCRADTLDLREARKTQINACKTLLGHRAGSYTCRYV